MPRETCAAAEKRYHWRAMKRLLEGMLVVASFAFALDACDSASPSFSESSGGGPFSSCSQFTSCDTCTPVTGCGWCDNSNGTGVCRSGAPGGAPHSLSSALGSIG